MKDHENTGRKPAREVSPREPGTLSRAHARKSRNSLRHIKPNSTRVQDTQVRKPTDRTPCRGHMVCSQENKLAVRPRLARKGVLGVYVNSKQHTRGELPVCAVPTLAGKLNPSWETAGKAPGNGRETTQPPLPHQGRQDHRANGAMAHRTCDTLNSK